jgi:hypothetical protein
MTPCILWTGWIGAKGYGQFRIGRRIVLAHRAAYEAERGPIPAGLVIDHLCRTPACVNVNHMEAVTKRENTLRGIGPSAMHALKTHCPKGHAYTESNTYIYRNQRTCRACNREAVARYKAKVQS